MKIAIVSSLSNHVECLGFLLDSIIGNSENIHTITVFTPVRTDHGYESYFMSLFDEKFKLDTFDNYVETNFDLCIKISAHDRKIKTDPKKTISIVHAITHDDLSHQKIVLSPYVKPRGKYLWMMSPYLGRSREIVEQTKKILWVGQLEDNWIDDDLINFVKSVDYYFTFVISAEKGNGSPLKKLINDGIIKNAEVINNMVTSDLIGRLMTTDLILCRKIPYQKLDRYSGVLTLAISHDIPMIINQKIAKDYDIPGIKFKNNYCELVDTISNMKLDDLKGYVQNTREYKLRVCSENRNKMSNILSRFN